jgi:hypothetical protein
MYRGLELACLEQKVLLRQVVRLCVLHFQVLHRPFTHTKC